MVAMVMDHVASTISALATTALTVNQRGQILIVLREPALNGLLGLEAL